MKKFKTLLLVLFSLSYLFGCGSSKYLEMPNDTNLEYWITQKVEATDFDNCTFLPGGFGCDKWLDSRYEAINEPDGGTHFAPDIHVTYIVSAYLDTSSKGNYVTRIEITDPEIYVYGLSMNSTSDVITSTMSNLGFVSNEGERWNKNNCTFTFSSTIIYKLFINVSKLNCKFKVRV